MDRIGTNQVRTILLEKPDLLFQIMWKPNVVCIKKSNQCALGCAQSGVARHTRAAILLFEILNPIKMRLKYLLELFSVRRAVVDDDHFEVFIGLRKNRIERIADK